jgi:hypothetical protein
VNSANAPNGDAALVVVARWQLHRQPGFGKGGSVGFTGW